jgi:hypothetical protein
MGEDEEAMDIDPILKESISIRLKMMERNLHGNEELFKELMETGNVKIGSIDILEPEKKRMKIVLSISYE